MPLELTSRSPAETEALGEEFGRLAQSGLVITLSGDLGAGKTQFVKGLARGLGVPGRIHSPSFTLVNEYEGGRLKLFHLDLYRLETRAQIRSAGIEEFLNPDGVSVIEWAERWFGENGAPGSPGPASKNFWRVSIAIVSETGRKIIYDHPGA